MLIDCTTCVARDIACGDCVVSMLLSSAPPIPAHRHRTGPGHDAVTLDDDAFAALGHLADAGLVPPLRLVEPLAASDWGDGGGDNDELPGKSRGIA